MSQVPVLLKKQAARLLRKEIGKPAREICKTYKKLKIVEELSHHNITIKIK